MFEGEVPDVSAWSSVETVPSEIRWAQIEMRTLAQTSSLMERPNHPNLNKLMCVELPLNMHQGCFQEIGSEHHLECLKGSN